MQRARMKLSDYGAQFIKNYEGCRLERYKCPAGKWTIGYGHLWQSGEPEEITKQKADQLFRQDALRYENGVNLFVTVPLTQGQFDALVSFAYNLGTNALAKSTLLKMLNGGNYTAAAAEFLRWDKAVKPGSSIATPLEGLTKRRQAEKAMFERG